MSKKNQDENDNNSIFITAFYIVVFVFIFYIFSYIFPDKFDMLKTFFTTNNISECSGNWNIWSDCNEITGKKTRTFNKKINFFNKFNFTNCPKSETISCQDCDWNWNDWSICDTYLGTKTRTINIIKAPLNSSCPEPETVSC
jgi:hypothetical protein